MKDKIKSLQQGSVLISILLFLTLASLAVALTLQASLLEQKISQQFSTKIDLTIAAQRGLQQTSLSLLNSKLECRIAPQPESYFKDQPLSWWLSSATCSINVNKTVIRYIIENYPAYPCLQIQYHNLQKKFTPNIYRITLLALSNNQKQHIILQAVYALPSQQQLSCEDKIKYLLAGQQSWAVL